MDREQQALFDLNEYGGDITPNWGWMDEDPSEKNGGQHYRSSVEGNGGQNKNSPVEGNTSMFTRSRGDDGTWIEKQTRKSGVYEYLRWRDFDGTKRAKYLGKV